ncbi:cation transporter [Marinicella rhabdoformis]|uniref:cation transporter n=1 Tax=Marinicella rhabdoformis TaxID=2580566 RepID=UPI0012AEB957|nr:cation transporter [Marinicella rhabdoformis]
MSDAVHSLTDVMNNVVIWLVMRVARKPAEIGLPFDNSKFEAVTASVFAGLLLVYSPSLNI